MPKNTGMQEKSRIVIIFKMAYFVFHTVWFHFVKTSMSISNTYLYLDKVSFCTQAGEQCEEIIQLLTKNDIGVEHNSTVRYILSNRNIVSFSRGVTRFIVPWSGISYFSMCPLQDNVIGYWGCSAEGQGYGMTPRKTSVRDLPEKFEICASKTECFLVFLDF